MAAKIVVDQREAKIIKYLEDTGTEFEIANLDIADIVFKIDDKTVFAIERKTKSDLVASIIDGRYKEQKIRLVEHFKKNGIPVAYVIEGFYRRAKHERIAHKNLLGALVNTALRDEIIVYHTEDHTDTGAYICELARKLPQFQGDNKEIAEAEYLTSVKKKRGDNINPENILVLMLCQIPKVGHNVARVIADKYKTITELSFSFEECPDEHPELMLSEIYVGKRRVGKVVSKQIHDFLYGRVA